MSCTEPGPPASDSGADVASDARDDARRPSACACNEPENCAACFANIGRCCYSDETILGHAAAMAARCDRSPVCHVCCSECAAMSCEQLRESNSCPPPPP